MSRFVLALLLALSTSLAHAQPLNRADVEAIVQQYIEKNGDKIMESIVMAQQKQQLAAATQAIRPHTPLLGSKNAPVTIIEFSDFECPFCDRVQPTVAKLQARYSGRVRWAFKNLPLEFHPKAKPAAYAAMAAHLQGKFTPYSRQLWSRQAYLGDELYLQLAKENGLDIEKFNKDRASEAVKKMVEQDLQDAEQVGARGTPFFLINGRAVSGALPETEFIKVIEATLNEKSPK